MTHGEQINPTILVWARETAGLNLRDAAKQIAFVTGDPSANQAKLLQMERGARLPTRTQLHKIAKTYRRPLLTFYLSAPPQESERGGDFRTTGTSVTKRENGLLSAVLRDIQARQEILTSALEDEDELVLLPFVASCTLQDDPEKIADRIRKSLRLSTNADDRPGSADELFRFLRTGIETMGVYVLLVGDLGSHHSALSEQVFRGFALADERVPFIVINDQDAKTARSFTLLHELVHIYLGATGISGMPEQIQGSNPAAKIEQFCNETASYVLLPRSFERERPASLRHESTTAVSRYIENTAKTWTVSEPLVAFRLRRLGWITPSMHIQFSQAYARRWQEQKEFTKSRNQTREGGPDYYTVKQYRLGNALIDAVRRTVRENRLTYTKAAKILGLKAASVEPMFRHFEKRGYAGGGQG